MNRIFTAFTRRKRLTAEDVEKTELRRCLSTFDLTALGVGCTLGAGVYVVTGEVARHRAGPAIVLSFLIAALASILSGLCYAELGSRVPKAGSAYTYTYVTIGELCAFVIGWNLLLEYILACSSVARAWSAFFDSLLGNHIHDATVHTLGKINVPGLAEDPDILAFIFVMIITLIVTSGAKQSSTTSWIFTSVNILVIMFVTVTGLVYAELKNWETFMPFGFNGVLAGAATCFYAFIGFDVIAVSAEEAKTPSKSISRAIIGSLLICTVAYLGASTALTLMLPYNELDEHTALATSFEQRGFKIGKYFVAVGAICGLSSSALNSLYPLPRILYSMGGDGVIFTLFGKVHERTGTPIIASVVSGTFAALLALLLDLRSLIEMLSIGTLLAYSLVALCVLLLRYRPSGLEIGVGDGTTARSHNVGERGEEKSTEDSIDERETLKESSESQTLENSDKELKHSMKDTTTESSPPSTTPPTWMSSFSQRLLGGHLDEPTEASYSVVKAAIVLFVLLTVALQSCLVWAQDALLAKDAFMIIFVIFLVVSLLIIIDVIGRQPQSKTELPFKVPLLPVIPLLALFTNLYLTLMLPLLTWVRFTVWMTIGMVIYLCYGVKHSKENLDMSDNHGYIKVKSNENQSD